MAFQHSFAPFLQSPRPAFPIFPLGQLVATLGAITLLRSLALSPMDFVARHANGDWGEIDDHDRLANRASLKDGSRLFSSYALGAEHRLWIITEADRSATTLLMPQEY